MAAFLPVAPANIIEALWQRDKFCTNAFFLAHEVIKDPNGYGRLRQLSRSHAATYMSGKQRNVRILDNSVIELGAAAGISLVQEAARIIGPCIVVLPDVLEKSWDTAIAFREAYSQWYNVFKDGGQQNELMMVPQGEDLRSWLWCLEEMLAFCKSLKVSPPRWVGIPRNTQGRIVESREQLVKLTLAIYPQAMIHLLGFSDDIIEDVLAAKVQGVQTIDSAVPCRVPALRLSIFGGDIPKRGTWWDDVKDTPFNDVHKNIVAQILEVNDWVK